MTLPLRALAPLLIAVSSTLFGQSIPEGGLSLIGETEPLPSFYAWKGNSDGEPVYSYQIVSVAGQSFTEAIQVSVINPAPPVWNGQVQFNGQVAVARNDVALIHFWARTTIPPEGGATAEMTVQVERSGEPYTKSVYALVRPGPEWTEYFFPLSFAEGYSTRGYQMAFIFGGGMERQIEIGGIEFLHFGTRLSLEDLPRTPFTYGGRDADAPWRAEAAARIEAHRMGQFSLKIRDPEGKAVDPIAVRFELFKHQFGFGSVISVPRLLENSINGETYRSKVKELFSSSGPENGLKWPPMVGDWGSQWSPERTALAMEWLRMNGFRNLRGHVLVWPSFRNMPTYIESLAGSDPASIPGEVLDRIDSAVSGYNRWLNEWDVVNEPYSNRDLMDLFGDAIMIDWFERARLNDPSAGLYLNDYAQLTNEGRDTDHIAETMRVLGFLIGNGAPVTGMGFQGHFTESALTAIPKVIELIDTYREAHPHLRFRLTEFDIQGIDDDLRADYTRDLMTLIFSDPSFDGFQLWGFWEGAHWRPEAAMYDMDWNELPNGTVFRTLVNETWTTDETTMTTNGVAEVSGYHGVYDVAFTHEGIDYRARIPFDASNSTYQLKLPSPSGAEIDGVAFRAQPSASPSGVILSQKCESGRNYEVEFSTDGASWAPLHEPMDGFPGTRLWVDPEGGKGSRLYRITSRSP